MLSSSTKSVELIHCFLEKQVYFKHILKKRRKQMELIKLFFEILNGNDEIEDSDSDYLEITKSPT